MNCSRSLDLSICCSCHQSQRSSSRRIADGNATAMELPHFGCSTPCLTWLVVGTPCFDEGVSCNIDLGLATLLQNCPDEIRMSHSYNNHLVRGGSAGAKKTILELTEVSAGLSSSQAVY